MKKLFSVLLVVCLISMLCAPVWAQGNSSKRYKNEDYNQKWKQWFHQWIVNHQFYQLKKMYNRSHPDAQQLFLDELGMASPDCDGQIQAVRADYEQQIAELNSSIASLQQQLENLTVDLNAQCDVLLTQAQETCETNTQQQLDALAASHQAEMDAEAVAHQAELDSLIAQKNAECDMRVAEELEKYQSAGPPQQSSFWDTGSVSPYAIDVDHSGFVFALDKNNLTVTEYDQTGVQVAQWNPGTLLMPADIALNSQGIVFVVDQYAADPIQKFGPDGTPMTFGPDSTVINYPFGLYVDSNDMIHVTDMDGSNVCKVHTFDPSGNLVRTFGAVPELAGYEYRDIVVDENNQMIYVVIGGFDNLVAKFTADGTYMGYWEGDFRSANGIAVADNGDIFVADTYYNEVDQYDSEGNLKYSFADDCYRPYHIVTDLTGKLFVADHGNMQIKVYE